MLAIDKFKRALLATAALTLGACTSLLGDFAYDPNPDGTGGSGSKEQGDIFISPPGGLMTSEMGTKATFTIVLKKKPTADVTVALTSSKPSEGTVNPGFVTFTAENFAAPQMVQVTGVDDEAADGAVTYAIITSPANSKDPNYAGKDAIDPDVTNVDNDTAGATLTPAAGLVTSESGMEAKFTVQLNFPPTADVTIPLGVPGIDGKPPEGSVSPAMLTFTKDNWMAPQMVTVTGLDDAVKDGDQPYKVVTGDAMSADAGYNGLKIADASVTNRDNESAGLVLTPPDMLFTYENGPMTSFTVSLSSPPVANVTVGLATSDDSEGQVSPAALIFTPENWMAPQLVSVTGVDDNSVDGNQPYEIVTSIQASDDPDYRALEPPNAQITNIDDDTPQLLIDIGANMSPLKTSEEQLAATFTVALGSKPRGKVVLDLSSSRIDEGTVSPALLTFTEANWKAPQVVTVQGVDDKVADGDQAYSVRVKPNADMTADDAYKTVLEQDVAMSNVDDDSPGVMVKPTDGLFTDEKGATATFTVRLTSQPRADVRIGLSSSNVNEGTVSPGMLVFTKDNYASEQLVTVRGVNDNAQDGSPKYRIITENAVSSDPGYSGREVPNVEVTNIDDDTAGITVNPRNVTLVTSEGGGTATFTVQLNTEPSADVTFSVTSNNSREGIATPSSLTFTKFNWNGPQTVTIKGQNDDVDDGPQSYQVQFGTISSGDANYKGDRLRPLDVRCTNNDNDTANISLITPPTLTTTEKNNGQATFQVKLDSMPSGDVTIGVSSNKPTEGTVSPATLTFTPINWSSPQTVTITGVDEKVQDGNQKYLVVFAPAVSNDRGYVGKLPNPPNLSVTNLDDDSAGVFVTPTTGLETSEPNGTTSFTVELQSQPTADVTIPIASSDLTEGTVSPEKLTFTPQNWMAPQKVTLKGVDDSVQDRNQKYVVSLGPIASNDDKYKPITIPELSVTNRDNDVAAVLVAPVKGLVTTEKNAGTASFTIALQTQPTADVTLVVESKDTTEGTVNPSSVKFTPDDWSGQKTITITGVDDKMQDSAQPYLVEVHAPTTTDAFYAAIGPIDVSVTNNDDDTAAILVDQLGDRTSESVGQPSSSTSFEVSLATQPSNNATVTISFRSNNTAEGVVSPSSLVFTKDDWAAPQKVTVSGVEDDGTADGNPKFNVVFDPSESADPNYDNKTPATLTFTNFDNDTAGIDVTLDDPPPVGQDPTTSEDKGFFTFSVSLRSKPKASVAIPVASSDTSEGIVSVSMLTFTADNWASKQSVRVTGVDDKVRDFLQHYTVELGSPTSGDPAYAAMDPEDIGVNNQDNDVAGIVLDKTGLVDTKEAGGSTSFIVRLRSQPTAPVTIDVSSSDPTEGKVSPATLQFTPQNWDDDEAHTVQVYGEDDNVQDGDVPFTVILSQSSSTDPNYDELEVADVDLFNIDNDKAGYLIAVQSDTTGEAAINTTFSVTLKSMPTDTVTIPISSSDTSEGSLNGVTSIVIEPDKWNVAHSVTVYGVDDEEADGNINYSIVLGKPVSDDGIYAKLDPPDVALTNNDDSDSAAFTISMVSMDPMDMVTGEAGTPLFKFKVVLTSKPKGPVTIPLLSSNELEGVVQAPAGQELVFAVSDWNVPQEVTIQGVDDAADDGDKEYAIKVGPPESTDSKYSVLPAQTVNLSNVDDD
jgi:large repetitive protein